MYYSKIILMLLITTVTSFELTSTENTQSQNSGLKVEQTPDSFAQIEEIIKNQLDSLTDFESVINYYPKLNQLMDQLIIKESDSVKIYSFHMKMLMTYSRYVYQMYQQNVSKLYDQNKKKEISILIKKHKEIHEKIRKIFGELCSKIGNNSVNDQVRSMCKSLKFNKDQQDFLNNIKKFPAPNFDVVGVMGEKVNLEAFKGNHVLLHFWSMYSNPSINELGLLLEINKKYSRNELKIISINADKLNSQMDNNVLKNIIQEMNLNWYHIADGNDRNIMDLFFTIYLPKMYLINKEGFIVYHCNSLNDEDLKLKIINLINE